MGKLYGVLCLWKMVTSKALWKRQYEWLPWNANSSFVTWFLHLRYHSTLQLHSFETFLFSHSREDPQSCVQFNSQRCFIIIEYKIDNEFNFRFFFKAKHLQQLGETFILPCPWVTRYYSPEIFKTTFWKKFLDGASSLNPADSSEVIIVSTKTCVWWSCSWHHHLFSDWQWRLFSNLFCLQSKSPYLIHRISSFINAYHFIIREWYSTKLSMKHSILMKCRLFPWQVNLGSFSPTIYHLPKKLKIVQSEIDWKRRNTVLNQSSPLVIIRKHRWINIPTSVTAYHQNTRLTQQTTCAESKF